MKRLKPLRTHQERWEHKGKTYSIVDLRGYPLYDPKNTPTIEQAKRWKDSAKLVYGDAPYELLDGDEISRYKTWQDARNAIKEE